ncbi:hypothetical protein AB1Y20_002221 [Prymnesium parvum]|uniref:HAT C-terminal dimerisation domain-containing protein n=1 Tax=Prymnesium parvum TaxID=97485 RepID=A0AB34J7W6_PRYPA
MCNSLRINQEPLLYYDVRNPEAATGFKTNRYSLEDWLINNQTVALLAPLSSASQYLEGKNYPTMNLVIPSLYGCIEHMNPKNPIRQPWNGAAIPESELRPEVKAAREELFNDLIRRWKTGLPENLKRFYLTATILDPRQKNLAFPGITSGERHEAREWFIAEYVSHWEKAPPNAAGGAGTHANTPAHPQHSGASFIDFMSNLSHLRGSPDDAEEEGITDTPEVAKNEAELYLELPAVPMKTQILKWWPEHEKEFPQLSLMARQYLGCPATSASAERLFSVAGRVYGDLRQNMDEDMLESLMWARINKGNRQEGN